MNARFWTWENGGWVKITLQPGAILRHSTHSQDEEGWSRERNAWEHTGDGVKNSYCSEGRDCDGFIRRTGALHCPLSRLATVPAYDDGTARFRPAEGRPDWQEMPDSARQYDESAIAANY